MGYDPKKSLKELQDIWYGKLKEAGFYDIESGLDSPPLLKPHHRPMNAAIAKAFVPKQGAARGREWEEILSDEDRWVDTHSSGRARYMHVAALVACQEYALCRLGHSVTAAHRRASWAMHAHGVSERDIAEFLGVGRWLIENYVAELKTIVLRHLDSLD